MVRRNVSSRLRERIESPRVLAGRVHVGAERPGRTASVRRLDRWARRRLRGTQWAERRPRRRPISRPSARLARGYARQRQVCRDVDERTRQVRVVVRSPGRRRGGLHQGHWPEIRRTDASEDGSAPRACPSNHHCPARQLRSRRVDARISGDIPGHWPRRCLHGSARDGHTGAWPLDLAEADGEPERQRHSIFRVNLRFEILAPSDRARAASASTAARPNTTPAPIGEDRELGDAPAVAPPPNKTESDDLAVDLDQKRQTARFFPVRVEIRVRLSPPVELEQVVREKPLKSVAIIEMCVTQSNRHAHERTRIAETGRALAQSRDSDRSQVTFPNARPGDGWRSSLTLFALALRRTAWSRADLSKRRVGGGTPPTLADPP